MSPVEGRPTALELADRVTRAVAELGGSAATAARLKIDAEHLRRWRTGNRENLARLLDRLSRVGPR